MSDDKIDIPSNKDTKVTTTKGILWSMLERFSTMGVQLLCTLVIAQYLSPNQFGLVGTRIQVLVFMLATPYIIRSNYGSTG